MIITPSAIELGFILKKISAAVDYDFSMSRFEDRLKLQKIIYLVQALGVYLGYDFSYYLRGPYCAKLAQTGFELTNIYDQMRDDSNRLFRTDDAEKKFRKSLDFIAELKCMDKWEIAASLHLLNHLKNMGKNTAIKVVMNKFGTDFTKEDCEDIWNKLQKLGLVVEK